MSEHAATWAVHYRWFGTPEAPSAGTTIRWRRGARIDRERVDAPAHADGARVLVGDQPRGDPAPRARGQAQPGCGVTAAGMFLRSGCRSTTASAARTHHRAGHPADVVFGGTWRRNQSVVAGGHRDHHRRASLLFSGPTGIAAGALLVAGPLKRLCRAYFTLRPARAAGAILAAGTVTIILIFRDQTLPARRGQHLQIRGRPPA